MEYKNIKIINYLHLHATERGGSNITPPPPSSCKVGFYSHWFTKQGINEATILLEINTFIQKVTNITFSTILTKTIKIMPNPAALVRGT